MNETQFTTEAEDMHAGAADYMTEAEKAAIIAEAGE